MLLFSIPSTASGTDDAQLLVKATHGPKTNASTEPRTDLSTNHSADTNADPGTDAGTEPNTDPSTDPSSGTQMLQTDRVGMTSWLLDQVYCETPTRILGFRSRLSCPQPKNVRNLVS